METGNPYLVVAKACLKKQDNACALDEFGKYSKHSGRDADSIKQYAKLLADAGQLKEAEAALERLNFISPLDPELHETLGNLYLENRQRVRRGARIHRARGAAPHRRGGQPLQSCKGV